VKKFVAVFVAIVALSCSWSVFASADTLGLYQQGGVNLNGPEYGWWYGCTATSAGMMMGYYDQKGYGGLSYSNLVPGGVAENFTAYGDAARNALVKDAIASQGHVNDYYRYWNGTAWVPDNSGGFNPAAYGHSGDDVATPTHTANCLADFMGTNQDAVGSSNGSTTLYYFTNGTKFFARDAWNYGVSASDGMYGIDEYLRYAGYGSGDITQDTSFFTQRIKSTSAPYGCSFADYQALIDAGLVVLIPVVGHSMFGYGYTDAGEIIFDDTWNGHNLLMSWGGSYDHMSQWGITVFTPSGGAVVPLPSTLLLMVSGLAGLVGWKGRFWQN